MVGIGEWAFLQGVSQTGAALASVFLGLTPIAVFVVYQVWQRAARPAPLGAFDVRCGWKYSADVSDECCRLE